MSEERERVLVIGGGGYLGKNLVEHLLERDKEVVIFDLVDVSAALKEQVPKAADRLSSIIGSMLNLEQVLPSLLPCSLSLSLSLRHLIPDLVPSVSLFHVVH